jgi:PAS domain S-box-containing protein
MWCAMLKYVLDYHLDLMAFAIVLMGATSGVHLWLRRQHGSRIGRWTWVLIGVITVMGIVTAPWAGRREQSRLRAMLEGIAPTYAQEMVLLDHASITLETPADDPAYLAMIEAEIRWQTANRNVSDIYTFGKAADGSIVLLVDAETDYDRNGVFEGERESRTDIGEAYDEATPAIRRAFEGEAGFDIEPVTDRWGTWVSAYVPLRDADGAVNAVLGVDYDASNWITAISASRAATLGFVALAAAITLAAGTVVTITRSELAKRAVAEAALRASEGRLRTILENEPEFVQLAGLDGDITQVNPAGLAVLEAAEAAEVLGTPLVERIDNPQRDAYRRMHQEATTGHSGSLRFALTGLRGGHRWLDACAVPLRDAKGNVTSVLSVMRDITVQKHGEDERERLQRELVDASRQAGMAEVATGVLHNVGNVLNSVNVSAQVLTDKLRRSKVPSFGKVAGLIRERRDDLAAFLTTDQKGKVIPDYLLQLSELIAGEQGEMLSEVDQLARSIGHIKQIVASQQIFAKGSDVSETFALADIIEDAIRINVTALERHGVFVERAYAPCNAVTADRHKVLQVLVNLIANAKDAMRGLPEGAARTMTIALFEAAAEDGMRVARVTVSDTGSGIKPDDMPKLFRHGFTTRSEGHGFGLHFCANAARQMKGSLTAHSDGPGLGATFVLDIPLQNTEATVA